MKPIYEFGQFRLDLAERQLLRGGQSVALTPKAFDLLVYLVEHHGHLVEKQSLMTALWPDTIVEEANLAYTISALRKGARRRARRCEVYRDGPDARLPVAASG